MPGIKGMSAAKPRAGNLRLKIWQSMRVMRRFTVPDLCRTSGANLNNVQKFVRSLLRHGYIAKIGTYVSGRAGSYQSFRIAIDTGPQYESRCRFCKQPLESPCTGDTDDR